MAISYTECTDSVADTSKYTNNEKRRNNQNDGDNCRNGAVKYTIKAGGRRMGKPKLNFRFHGSDSTEALTRQILRVCIDANMKRIEQIMREEAALALDSNDKKEESNYENP